jgi:type II secretory pathway pseudopilin PulG
VRRVFGSGSRRAFTIFELMNLLALAGMVGAVGMFALARYARHAKTAEAIGSLSALAKASAAYYDASDATQPVGTTPDAAHAMCHFPPPSSQSVPPSPEDVRGKRYQSSPADWSLSPWHELQFSIPQPQYFAYSYVSEGSGATAKANAIARGDLDGDGAASTYAVPVTPDSAYRARVGPMAIVEPDE